MHVYLGACLFCLFFLQEIMDYSWPLLFELQQQQSYKKWTGGFLATYIISQWLLYFVKYNRNISSKRRKQIFTVHQWNGALAPVYFYVHSISIGYGYLLLLSTIYLGNFLVGLIRNFILKFKKSNYYMLWLSIHIALSVLIIIGICIHIWVVYYFE